MSIPLFHDRQIDVASMMAPETFLFTISKKKNRRRQELPTVVHGKSGSVHGCNHR